MLCKSCQNVRVDVQLGYSENQNLKIGRNIYTYIYTGCPRRKGQNLGRVFLMLKYADITQNTYIQS